MSQVLVRRSTTNATPTTSHIVAHQLAYTDVGGVVNLFIRNADDEIILLGGDSKANVASPALTGAPTTATPTASATGQEIVNATWVRGRIQEYLNGLSYKAPVRVASTANVDISSELVDGVTIDGVTLATGDRVLLKDQTDASENGIYTVAASGAAPRASDFDVSAEVLSGATIPVREGTVSEDTSYTLTTDGTITLDTTSLTFSNVVGASTVIAGDGIDKSGNTVSVDITDILGTGLEDDGSNNIRLAAQGNGIAGGNGTVLSVAADTTTGATVAAVSVTSNGVGVGIDNASIVHSSNVLAVGVIDDGTF